MDRPINSKYDGENDNQPLFSTYKLNINNNEARILLSLAASWGQKNPEKDPSEYAYNYDLSEYTEVRNDKR